MQNRRRQAIRAKVSALLAENKVKGPKVDPEKIAIRYGIVVRKEPIDGNVSGFLVRHPKKSGTIIGINSSQPRNRQRFTLAHELGHYFLHSGQGYEEVHVDPLKFLVRWRDADSSKGVDLEEIEANVFAAELLMPLQFLVRDIKRRGGFDLSNDDAAALDLARTYGVSSQAMSFRLSNLERFA